MQGQEMRALHSQSIKEPERRNIIGNTEPILFFDLLAYRCLYPLTQINRMHPPTCMALLPHHVQSSSNSLGSQSSLPSIWVTMTFARSTDDMLLH
ncbi:hypothetical protein VTO58DRAFT_111356 [Aureobasidium pullulans]